MLTCISTELNLTARELRSWALQMAAVIVWPTALKRRLLVGRPSSSIYPDPLLPFTVFPRLIFLPFTISLSAKTKKNTAIFLFRDAQVLIPPALTSDSQICWPPSILTSFQSSKAKAGSRPPRAIDRDKKRISKSQRVNGDFSECAPNHQTDADCTAGKLAREGDFPHNHRTAPTSGPPLFSLLSMLHKTVQ